MPVLNRFFLDNLAAVVLVLAAAVVVLAIALIILSLRLRASARQYRELIRGTSGGSLQDVLDAHVERVMHVAGGVDELSRLYRSLEERSHAALQHVGMVRFNPFEDTGSDQSFAIALLDDRRDGVVISSLHGRNATRVFAKPVEGGKSRHSLSDEESQAIQVAIGGTPAAAAPR